MGATHVPIGPGAAFELLETRLGFDDDGRCVSDIVVVHAAFQ